MEADATKTSPGSFGKMTPPAYRVVVFGKGAGKLDLKLPLSDELAALIGTFEGGGVVPIEGSGGLIAVFGRGGSLAPNVLEDVYSSYAAGGVFSRLLADVVNMEQSVSALGPAIAALDVETSPPLASAIQATENLWTSIARRWGLLRSTDVAELLGAKSSNRSFASGLRKKGKIIGVERTNAYLYPGFQFDRTSGTVHDVVPRLISAARAQEMDDEDLVFWLCSPSRYFDDDLPVEHLLDDPRIVEKFVAGESISW